MTKESCHFEGAERLRNPKIPRFVTRNDKHSMSTYLSRLL